MLTTCPECGGTVSTEAAACPHCGYPINRKVSRREHTRKHKRLPNGFGQISEIKGKRLRKPFRAMVTVGKNEYGKPICKLLKPQAYFSTYNEAYEALMEYNKNPYELDAEMTVKDLYEKWLDETAELRSTSWRALTQAAWKYCSVLYDTNIKDIRPKHIRFVMDHGTAIIFGKERTAPPTIKIQIKGLFAKMLDYALEYDLVDRNYARSFKTPERITKETTSSRKNHIAFSESEISTLWEHADDEAVQMLLIQCYSGWRPTELCLLKISNVDLASQTIVGGMKTKAGTNRVVPIHSKVLPFIEAKYNKAVATGSEYLFSDNSYVAYKKTFMELVDKYKLDREHRPHDGRKTFVTLAKAADMDEYAIKYIVGHAVTDLTEKIYTERNVDWLKSEIEKIR